MNDIRSCFSALQLTAESLELCSKLGLYESLSALTSINIANGPLQSVPEADKNIILWVRGLTKNNDIYRVLQAGK